MPFMDDNFLLRSGTARRLYESYAAPQPILDFHCHLPASEVAGNRRFRSLAEIWLEGDHYKWRAMRANGVAERYCTGDAEPYEKFLAWASTVPQLLRNPLYHWTHLELRRYFGITELLDAGSAPGIWRRANEMLAAEEFSAWGILRKFAVRAVATTDDPADSLTEHERLRASGLATRVYPAFRPDASMKTADAAAFNAWTDRLAASADVEIRRLPSFLDALERRHAAFHALGCRASDHGLDRCPWPPATAGEAEVWFAKLRGGRALTPEEGAAFAGYLLLFFGRLDAEKGWVQELHLGALRNANSRMERALGANTGFDSMRDEPQVAALAAYCDALESEGRLPKMILYNLNPADNYAFAALTGNFQGGEPGKLQLGSGWWFLDQKEGMEWQLNALSNCGLLSRFVGMATDSRSFMSYPRHEYFRRILCNLIGGEVESGELPGDEALVGGMIRAICHDNAERYFAFPAAAGAAPKE